MSKAVDFYHAICAFQHFAGKSLKITDAAECLTDQEIATVLATLNKVANWCLEQDKEEWQDLHRLAQQITNEIHG